MYICTEYDSFNAYLQESMNLHPPQFRYGTIAIGRMVCCLVTTWLLAGALQQTVAQRTDDVDPVMNIDRSAVAPVIVDGNHVFYVRGISSYPADQRAETISNRIINAASDDSVAPDSIFTFHEKDRLKIYAGDHFIMNLYESDAEQEGIMLTVLADLYHQKLKQTIIHYRLERSGPVMIKKSLYALGALILMVLLMFGFLKLIRLLNNMIQNRYSARIQSVENKSFNLIQSGQFWKAFRVLIRFLRIVTIVVLAAIFLQYVLGLFPWTNSIAAYTLNLFLDPLMTLLKGFVAFIPNMAFLIVIFFVTRYLLKLIKLLFNGIQAGEFTLTNFKPEWALPTYRILRIMMIAFAVIIAYPYIPGSESNAFKGVTVFLGVLFSLGSSSFIGNVIAGYSMTYRGAFKNGDRIMVDGNMGIVEEQKLLVTRLRSPKNEEIVIPNSVLLGSTIVNYSTKARENGLILHTVVGIGYETPWRQVEAMLKLAASRTEGLLTEPPPFVLHLSLGDFAVNYELNVYCDDALQMPLLYTRLHRNILDVFNENNVQIMTPAYEGDPEIPKVVPKDQWFTPLAEE